jgi:methyl-accepting chemotaxis protein
MRLAPWLAKLRATYLAPVTLIRLIPISVVLVTGLVLTQWTHGLLTQHRTLVVHTHEVIEMAKDVLIGLVDAETGQRGYLLSGDPAYLRPYELARGRLVVMEATLTGLVQDNTDQVARVGRLSQLIRRKLDELSLALPARQQRGYDAAAALVAGGDGQATMDAIRAEIGGLTEAELSLLRVRDVEVETDEHRIRIVAVLVGLASLLTRFAVEFYLTWRSKRVPAAH